jgi:hypothetical protein
VVRKQVRKKTRVTIGTQAVFFMGNDALRRGESGVRGPGPRVPHAGQMNLTPTSPTLAAKRASQVGPKIWICTVPVV